MVIDDLDVRVSVLEVEHKHTREELNELKKYSEDICKVVYEIKEKLDKQNRCFSLYT